MYRRDACLGAATQLRAVNDSGYVGAYADGVAAWDRLLADQQTVLRLLSSFGMWRTPICLDDLIKLDPTGWQADFLDDYRRAATNVRGRHARYACSRAHRRS